MRLFTSALDGRDVLGRQRRGLGDVETQPVGCDERTLLRDVVAQTAAQRFVQQMRGRMVGARAVAALHVDAQFDEVADLDRALRHAAHMDVHVAGHFLRILDGDFHAAGREDGAGIAHLAAGFAVERRLVDDQRDLVAGLGALDFLALDDESRDLAFGALGLVAEEFGSADLLAQFEPHAVAGLLAGTCPRAARFFLGLFHRGREAVGIHTHAARAQHVLREVEREAVGVVELEGDVARELVALAEAARGFVEQLEAAVEHRLEARLFELQRFGRQRRRAHDFGEGLAHRVDERGDQLVQQRLLAADDVRVAHRAAHDPAQHVAAALVRRQHAVGDQEDGRAQMVGDHAVRDRVRPVGGDVRGIGRSEDDPAHQVDVVVVVLALQHGRDALQPHARVDRGFGQRDALARRDLLELHEDEIPDLDEAVAVGIGRTRRAARDLGAVVVEDFRARAAGAGVAHRPEIVGRGDADDLVLGQARDLLPQVGRRVVVVIDGDAELVLGQAVFPGDQRPGMLDRLFLEIVAEREIAEHLEERVVARGVAHVLEVVVLAAGAHAFLRGGRAHIGALLLAGEDVLELHHAGVREHQRGVVARHERRGSDDLVAVLREIIEEGLADVARTRHGRLAL